MKESITLEAKEAQVEHSQLKIKYKDQKDELETKKKALQDVQDQYKILTIDETKTNEQLREQGVVPGHLTTCQQGRLPAVENQGDLTSIEHQRSLEYNTSIEPATLDTTTEDFGDSYNIMSESEASSACRPKRRRENDKKPRKTERDSSSDSSYKSSKENFKIPEQPRQKKNEVESKSDKKIKKLEESKKKDSEKMQEMKKTNR